LLFRVEDGFSIGPNFDYYTKIKIEYQYTDYSEYKWPDYIEYVFGEHPFSQPNPILNSFPEHRWLTKITQAFGPNTELQLMYHYSFLGKEYYYNENGIRGDYDTEERLYNSRLEYKVKDNLTVNATAQYTIATGGLINSNSGQAQDLRGVMSDFGFIYDFGGFFKVEPSFSQFWNKYGNTRSNAQSYNLKLRQAVTNTTAIQIKFSYFNTEPVADQPGLKYGTVTGWFSQWLPSKTALHFFLRYHSDNQKNSSLGPGIEISQYLNWATILTLSYRHYDMIEINPESAFSQTLKNNSFISDAITVLVSRTMWNDTLITLKYRYYTCNQDISMHTYLLGLEQVF
jgi:hypothetical protein